MKKILLLIALIAFVGLAQNTDKSSKTLTTQEVHNKVFENTVEAMRVKVVNASSSLPTGTDFTDGTEGFATAIDTLSGASDTVTFNFGNQFKTCAVVLKDIAGGGDLIDSVKIESYNSKSNTWGTKIVGLYESNNGDILQGDAIIPGNGTTKKYYLIDLYPSQIRISWYYGANKVGRTMPISFEGSN